MDVGARALVRESPILSRVCVSVHACEAVFSAVCVCVRTPTSIKAPPLRHQFFTSCFCPPRRVVMAPGGGVDQRARQATAAVMAGCRHGDGR